MARSTLPGSNGGGAIRVGGGLRGGEGLPIAARAYVAEGATLDADATAKGNDGSVAVFSQSDTVVAGNLLARGGVDGGAGGLVETSSHGGLTVTNTPQVGARAAGGSAGEWLIDPNDIDIVAGNGNDKINAANPFASTDDSAILGVDLITAALTGGANVTVTTSNGVGNGRTGKITLDADLDYQGAGSNSLTFDAAGNVQINNKIFDSLNSSTLNLTLIAGDPGLGAGSGNIGIANDISLGGGYSGH